MRVSPEKFLGGLVHPLLDGELDRIVDCFETPMLIIRSDGHRGLQDRETTIAELEAQAATLLQLGAVGGRIEACEVRHYGGCFTMADLRIDYLDQRAHTVFEQVATYLLRIYDESWKVSAQITHFEWIGRSAA